MEVIPTKQEETLIQQLSSNEIFKTSYAGGSVTASRNGKHLIVVNDDGATVDVYPLHGPKKFSYKGDTTEVLTMTVSNNSRYLAVSYSSGLIYLYDLNVPKEHTLIIRTPNTSSKSVSVTSSLSFSQSNAFIAMGSNDGYVRVYDLINKYFTHSMQFSYGLVTSVLFDDSDSKQYFVYAASDTNETIRRFNLHTNQHKDLFGHLNGIVGMILEEQQLISISKDNVMIHWNMTTLKPSITTPIPSSIFLNEFGDEFLIGTDDGNIVAYSKKTLKELWRSKEEQRLLSPGALLVSGEEIVHVSYDGYFIYYDSNGNVKSYNCLDRDSVICCHPLESSEVNEESPFKTNEILLINNSNALEIYNFMKHSSQLLYGHDDLIMTYCFSPNKQLIFVGFKDGYIEYWDLMTKKVVGGTEAHSGPITAIGHSTVSNMIATGANDKFIKIFTYDVNEQTIKQTDAFAAHMKEINSLRYSVKDKYLVSTSADKTAKLWVPSEGYGLKGELKGHKRAVMYADFSPIEQVVMTCSTDGTMKIWSVNTLSALRTFQGHNGGVCKAIFINDGVQIVSIGTDGTLRLWTVKTGENTQTLEVSDDRLWNLVMMSKDKFIITGDSGLVSLITDVTKEKVEERITQREEEILKGQQLNNLMREKKWNEALIVAIQLGLPKEAYMCCENCDIDECVKQMSVEDVQKFYSFVRTWNERNVMMAIAQKALNSILKNVQMDKLNDGEFKKSLERMKELNEKHLNTLEGYYRKALFIDFLSENVKTIPNEA